MPLTALSKDRKSIRDLSETTGRYYADIKSKVYYLHRNKSYWNDANKYAPHHISFVKDEYLPDENDWISNKLIISGGVDMIPTFVSLGGQFEFLKKNAPKPSFHRSPQTKIRFYQFTEKGRNVLSAYQRQIISRLMREEMENKFVKRKIGRFTSTIIPNESFGGLNPKQYKEREAIDKKLPNNWPDDLFILVGVPHGWGAISKIFERYKKHIVVIEESKGGKSYEKNKKPHLELSAIYVEPKESTLQMSQLLSKRTFVPKDMNKESWLDKYASLKHQKDREAMYSRIHFDSLVTDPSIIPISKFVLRGISVNGWKLDGVDDAIGKSYLWKFRYME
ncbi:MAG: hypothetical protein HRU19_26715 [Pseudobacteriovorax sp.]|nr:hypothetical protein [Pseudobacteriovorax sp.]